MAKLCQTLPCMFSMPPPPAAQAGMAITAGQIPWEMTPILGLITDTLPIFGYHRKAYLVLVGIAGGRWAGGHAGGPGLGRWAVAPRRGVAVPPRCGRNSFRGMTAAPMPSCTCQAAACLCE